MTWNTSPEDRQAHRHTQLDAPVELDGICLVVLSLQQLAAVCRRVGDIPEFRRVSLMAGLVSRHGLLLGLAAAPRRWPQPMIRDGAGGHPAAVARASPEPPFHAPLADSR